MRIENIQYDSNPDNFINQDVFGDYYYKNVDPAIQVLSEEMENGGLDQWSLNIDGTPIAHNHAGFIKKALADVDTQIGEVLLKMMKKIDLHRRAELEAYQIALNAKKKTCETEKKNTSDEEYKNYLDGIIAFCNVNLPIVEEELKKLPTQD